MHFKKLALERRSLELEDYVTRMSQKLKKQGMKYLHILTGIFYGYFINLSVCKFYFKFLFSQWKMVYD
jgi:hypothetical protein